MRPVLLVLALSLAAYASSAPGAQTPPSESAAATTVAHGPAEPEAIALGALPAAVGMAAGDARPIAALDSLTGRFVVQPRPAQRGPLMGPTALTLTSVLNQVANDVNRVLRLPRDVPIHSEACGRINAFYRPSDGSIVVCDEMAPYTADALGRWAPEDDRHGALYGALEFVTLHEIGHALVHQLDLTVYNQDEDVADVIATVLALEANALDRLAGSLVFWDASARDARANRQTMPFWDEHSFDEQRMASIACLWYGADPIGNADIAGSKFLPLDPESQVGKRRLAICEDQFHRSLRDLARQLQPYLPQP